MNSFTVVVPSYNSAGYISETLDSIVEASQGRDYEVVIVDDCSLDIDELEKVVAGYSCVNLIKKEIKSNAAHSRNIGITISKHELIFLLDSDDMLIDGAVDQRLKLHEDNGAGIVFGNYVTRRGKTLTCSNMSWSGERIRDFLFDQGGDFRTSTISIYKPYFKGTMFDGEAAKHQDWIFGMKCCDAGERMLFDVKPISIIDVGSNQRMSSKQNYLASQFMVDKYLNEQRHVNGFSRKHWRSAVANQDVTALKYYMAIFQPQSVSEHLVKLAYKISINRTMLGFASYMIVSARRLKWLV